MRKLVALSVALAALALAADAGAAGDPSLSLKVSGLKVLFGHSVTLTGRIAPRRAGRSVEVLAWPHGRSSPVHVATVTTVSGGRWTARVRPSIATTYKARSGSILSQAFTVDVEPLLSIEELGDGRILAHAAAGRTLAGRTIQLQQRKPGGWATIRAIPLRAGSSAIFGALAPTNSAPVRLALSVNQAGAGYLGATSAALVYHALALTLAPSSYRMLYGHSITLSGRLWHGHAGDAITIMAWPYGHSAPRHVATVTADANGRWSLRVSPTIRTAYQARWTTTQASPRVPVGVAPDASVVELANGHVRAHVQAARSLAGRYVQLQEQMPGGAWRTIAKKALGAGSATVFAVKAPGSMLRLAMSVNEAGAGYLGATSGPIRYRAR